MKKITSLAVAAFVASTPMATAAVVDFEDGQGCDNEFATITAGAGEEACNFSPGGMTGTRSLVRSSERGDTFWTATFARLASNISIEMGDRTNDDDRLFLRAFSAAGTLLDEALFDSLGPNSINHSLSLTVEGAAYATFGVTGDLGAGSGIFADNLVFTLEPIDVDPPIAPVPLPAAGLLLIAGLGGLVAMRRRAS